MTGMIKTSALFALVVNLGLAQALPSNLMYLSQPLPGPTPKKFELATTPGYFAAERICISKDGREIYYSELNGYTLASQARTKVYRFENGTWNGPFPLFESFAAPILSPSGDTLYLEKNFETYASERTKDGWSEPKRLHQGAHYFQQIPGGTCYLSSTQAEGSIGKFDWSELQIKNGKATMRSLGAPLNGSDKNLDFYMAKDASYLIFAHFADSLFISYRKPDNTWTKPKILLTLPGTYLWGPWLSHDGQYLFFTGGESEPSTCTYWVKLDGQIQRLRHTNFTPYVQSKPTNQPATSLKPFHFALPKDVFVDDDGNQTLTYSATLKNGDPLPSWLSFDAGTRTLSGVPPESGVLTIKVTATDTAQASASTTFDICTDRPLASSKPVITKPSDIPDHSYLIQGKPSDVLQNPERLLALAQQLGQDKAADLDKYDIQDGASLASLHNSLYVVALLKQDHAAASQHLEQVRGFQQAPLRKLMSGLFTAPYLQAIEQPGADFHATFRALLDKALAALPFQEVQGQLRARLEGMKALSKAQLLGAIQAQGDPLVKDGHLSEEMAEALLSTAMNLQVILPLKDDIVAALENLFQANAKPVGDDGKPATGAR